MNPHACTFSAALGSAGFAQPARSAGAELRSTKPRLHPPKGAATSLRAAVREIV
ncbi:Uncharacterized protein pbN1_05790 [Aromatoleum bremense]|nr:Uncharacterized protein pbN1_05790 [Aromatoleum bremense]